MNTISRKFYVSHLSATRSKLVNTLPFANSPDMIEAYDITAIVYTIQNYLSLVFKNYRQKGAIRTKINSSILVLRTLDVLY